VKDFDHFLVVQIGNSIYGELQYDRIRNWRIVAKVFEPHTIEGVPIEIEKWDSKGEATSGPQA
jgi:hypothetical protein